MMLHRLFVLFLVILPLTLSACDSAEERAEEHFQSAQELIEEGDTTRALVELRNVLKLDESHRAGRRTFARLLREKGDEGGAFNQYRRLVEQYPDDAKGLKALSEIAVARHDWESARRFVPAAAELAPEDVGIQALQAAVKYHAAQTGDEPDPEAVEAARKAAAAALEQDPGLLPAREVLIDARLQENDGEGALTLLDEALDQAPDNLRYHQLKLQLLQSMGRTEAVGAHLEEINRRFPENERIRNLLIGWYISQDELDEAEAFLRRQVEAAAPEDRVDAQAGVIEFLRRSRGLDAAIEEADRLIEASAGEDAAYFRTLRAALLFDKGERDTAISEMQTAIEGAEGSGRLLQGKVALARMLIQTGDEVGARARVEEVLKEDPSNVAALRMRATWQIEDDKADAAINTLREALNQAPRDPETLMLMARAHLRNGSRQLAGERLSLAVEASNQGAEESLAYADFLISDDKTDVAERVLVDALRRAPADLRVLDALGKIYLQQADWGRAQGVVDRLQEIGTPAAKARGNAIRTSLLQRQEKFDESTAFVEDLIAKGEAPREATALVLQGKLRDGDLEGARKYLDEQLAEAPDDPSLRYMQAGLQAAAGETEAAEKGYRALIEAQPANPTPVRALFFLLMQDGRAEAADTALQAGIEATGGSRELRKLKASRQEAKGELDAAIETYAGLYDENSDDVIIANNLASLLSTERDDAESLERAARIARRLRGTDIPAFQDTYGWIEHRRGNSEAALDYLQPAAEALSGDPRVQAHLGLAQAAADQPGPARETLTRALEIAGEAKGPLFDTVRARLQDLPPAAEN